MNDHDLAHESIKLALQSRMASDALKLLLAWEAGELSEGQIMKALAMERVSVRQLRLDALSDARVLSDRLTVKNP